MPTLEQNGFATLCSFGEKMSLAHGALLIGGAAVSVGLSVLTNKASAPNTEIIEYEPYAFGTVSPEQESELKFYLGLIGLPAEGAEYERIKKVIEGDVSVEEEGYVDDFILDLNRLHLLRLQGLKSQSLNRLFEVVRDGLRVQSEDLSKDIWKSQNVKFSFRAFKNNALSAYSFDGGKSLENYDAMVFRHEKELERLKAEGKAVESPKILLTEDLTMLPYMSTGGQIDPLTGVPLPKEWGSYEEFAKEKAATIEMMEENERLKRVMRRRRDLLARRDPEWAIWNYPHEYDRGKRIAPMMKEVVDYVASLNRQGEKIFIHGRDGELVFDLLKRVPGIDMSRISYAITSRKLSLEPHSKDYERYLRSKIPKGAVHVDTGFLGTIPMHLQALGYDVKRAALIRHEPDVDVTQTVAIEQIPSGFGEKPIEYIVNELEHAAQRLESPREQGWGKHELIYAQEAPGYHARYYGVLDALGIPRLKSKTPLTRFEQRQGLKEKP